MHGMYSMIVQNIFVHKELRIVIKSSEIVNPNIKLLYLGG